MKLAWPSNKRPKPGPAALLAACLLLTSGLFSLAARAQTGTAVKETPAVEQKTSAIDQARSLAQEILARGIPGLAVAVAVDGKIIWSEGFGYADLEARVPAWPNTRFRIGSVSKPLTTAALVMLREQGRLDLDAPVQRYVPEFPDKGVPITSRLLAGHLGGIRHYQGNEFLIQEHYMTVPDSLTIFQNDPLVVAPGTKFSYSSYGFNLLSAVIEGASGEEFLSHMQKHIFSPLGLRDTVPDENAKIVERRTRFYSRDAKGPLKNGPYVDNSYKWAGGGFLSSAEDLVRFGSALLQPGFLKADSLALLFTSQRTKTGEETGYGMGWSVGKTAKNQMIYRHGGGSIGGTSQLAIFPERRLVVAIVTNLTDAPLKNGDREKLAEPFLQ